MTPRRTKVLFAIGTLGIGGAERQLLEMASGLDRSRFEAVVCSLAGEGPLTSAFEQRGIRVHNLAFRGLNPRSPLQLLSAGREMARFWRIMRRERPDVFHGVLFWAYITGTIVARAAHVPIVIASRRSLGLFKAHKRHYLALERLADRLTDLFIANSEAVRSDTIAREHLDPSKVIVIYNGLDPARYCIDRRAEVRAALGLAERPAIVVVSNFLAYKGHRYFFEAWKDVVRRFPEVVALMVGEGPLRSQWEEWCRAEGVAATVRFLGTRHDVDALLSAATMFVHPSTEEGYSNAILEAMASALPVVATAVGGNVEALDDGVTGLLVPSRDPAALAEAIMKILQDPRLGTRLGSAARRKVVERFQIGRMVNEYERVYDRLAAAAKAAKVRKNYVWNRRSI